MKFAAFALAATLLASIAQAGPATQANAGPQDQAAHQVTIVISQIIDMSEGVKVIRCNENGNKAVSVGLNIMDASTFGDAKLMKLMSASDDGTPITIVIRGNVITDVL